VTEFLLVRHGETDWNAERRWQGHADRPLNERGRAQAKELAELLAGEPIDAVYSSDLSRARETAAAVAARLGADVRTLRELREIDVGEFSGLTAADVEERHPEAMRRLREHGYGWTSGESPRQMEERVLAALRHIAAEHPGGRVLVVGHGGTIRAVAALASALGYGEYRRRNPVVENCSVTRIAYEDNSFRSLD
jgi:probable phosphoglycerate mutase